MLLCKMYILNKLKSTASAKLGQLTPRPINNRDTNTAIDIDPTDFHRNSFSKLNFVNTVSS